MLAYFFSHVAEVCHHAYKTDCNYTDFNCKKTYVLYLISIFPCKNNRKDDLITIQLYIVLKNRSKWSVSNNYFNSVESRFGYNHLTNTNVIYP